MERFWSVMAVVLFCAASFQAGYGLGLYVEQQKPKLCDCSPCKCQGCPCPAERDPAVGAEPGDSIVSIDGDGVIVRRFRWCDGRRTNSVIRMSHDEFRQAYRFLPLGRVGEVEKGKVK